MVGDSGMVTGKANMDNNGCEEYLADKEVIISRSWIINDWLVEAFYTKIAE